MEERRLKISAHHGDAGRPNNLATARTLLEHHDEIDVMEIDFVTFRGHIVSSHDYDASVIVDGSPLEEWMRFVVGERHCVLWIDVKENSWLYMNWMYGQFDVALFFQTLRRVRRALWREDGQLDVTALVWIGCQDPALRQRLVEANDVQRHPWQMMLDVPMMRSYVWKMLTPSCLAAALEKQVMEELLGVDYKQAQLLSLDHSFFASRDALIAFLRKLKLRRGATLILYSFPRDVKPIQLRNVNVVMQYDYFSRDGQ